MPKITIKQIAKEAGVSAGTVDRVLHNRGKVDKAKEKVIRQIIKRLNYEPNKYASALASNKELHLACLIPNHNPQNYWGAIYDGIQEGVKELADFNVIISYFCFGSFSPDEFETKFKSILNSDEFNGVILAPTFKNKAQEFCAELDKRDIPYVFVDSLIDDTNPKAFFTQDPIAAGKMLGFIISNGIQYENKSFAVFEVSNNKKPWSVQNEKRLIGLKDYLETYKPDVKAVECILPATRNKTKDHAIISDFFSRHPEIHRGVILNSRAYILGEYFAEFPNPSFLLAGFDLIPRNVKCIKNGTVKFLMSQRPKEQGLHAVKVLCDLLLFNKKIQKEHYMSIDLLNRFNIDYYPEYKTNNCYQYEKISYHPDIGHHLPVFRSTKNQNHHLGDKH